MQCIIYVSVKNRDFMLSVVKLSVVMLSVVVLNDVAPLGFGAMPH
jgi:hypothetical protein